MKFLKLVLEYLHSKLSIIILVALVWLTCAVVYYAYNLPPEPIQYAFLLGSVLMLPVILINFANFAEKHSILKGIAKNAGNDLRELPQSSDMIELDYQEIIRSIADEKMDLVSKGDIRRKENSEYYTMWIHQIKTPIAAAGLMLQSGTAADPQKLMRELMQIEQYADMALNYARLESIHNDLELRWCPIDDIVGKALKKYSRIFLMQKFSLNFTPSGETALTDEKWLLFIVEQLLSNALKYSNGGSITINMEPGKLLCIKDQGIGIRPEDLPRIFEKGFTGYNGRQDKKSSGIGLYMCKKVADVLSHTIEVESQPELGTCVRIDLSSVQVQLE